MVSSPSFKPRWHNQQLSPSRWRRWATILRFHLLVRFHAIDTDDAAGSLMDHCRKIRIRWPYCPSVRPPISSAGCARIKNHFWIEGEATSYSTRICFEKLLGDEAHRQMRLVEPTRGRRAQRKSDAMMDSHHSVVAAQRLRPLASARSGCAASTFTRQAASPKVCPHNTL